MLLGTKFCIKNLKNFPTPNSHLLKFPPGVKYFCTTKPNTELTITQEKNLEIIDKTIKLHNLSESDGTALQKINKMVPLETFNENANDLKDLLKYKVFEDSVKPAIEEIKKDVPELENH